MLGREELSMTILDWVIIFVPALIAAGALLFGGLKILIQRIGNANLAIGIFGTVLCGATVAAYTHLLSEPARLMLDGQTKMLAVIGVGNLLLAIWSYFRPNRSSGS